MMKKGGIRKLTKIVLTSLGSGFILFYLVFLIISNFASIEPQTTNQNGQNNEEYHSSDDGGNGSKNEDFTNCSSSPGSTVAKATSDLNTADILNSLNFSDILKTTEKINLDPLMAPHHWTGDVGRLKVVIVPHSHNDPGWLETFESYYETKTKKILDLLLDNLGADPSLKFIWAEISFFSSWWEGLNEVDRRKTKKILKTKQLEFVNGGWVMPDEANSHYYSLVSQLIEGQIWLKHHLNYETKNGWTIDPFGLSPTQAYLLRLTGVRNLVIQRVHFALKRYLAEQNELEFNWRQTWDSNGSADILCHVMPYNGYTVSHTCGPNEEICCQFDFFYVPGVSPRGVTCAPTILTMDVTPQNIYERSMTLVDSYRRKSLLFKTNSLLVPLGDDFRWISQSEWDAQVVNYKRLIGYINDRPQIFNMDVSLGSLQDYFEVVNEDILARNFEPKSLTGDFFPYVDHNEDYWTGYFTSRPFHKVAERRLAAILRGSQISFSLMLAQLSPKIDFSQLPSFIQNMMTKMVQSRRQLSLFQHHDGITGTSKAMVVIDYAQRLFKALKDCEHVMQQSLHILTNLRNPNFSPQNVQNNYKFLEPILSQEGPLDVAKLLFISFEQNDTEKVIVVFNPETKIRTQLIHFGLAASGEGGGVNDVNLIIQDFEGNEMDTEIFPMFKNDDGQIEPAVVQFSFLATIRPLETKRFFVRRGSSKSGKLNIAKVRMSHVPSDGLQHSVFGVINFLKEPLQISNHQTKLFFNKTTGHVQKALVNGTEIFLGIKFMAYRQTKSGMYLFKPSGPAEDLTTINGGFYLNKPPKIFQVTGKLYSYVQLWLPQVKHRVGLYNHGGLDSLAIHIENSVDIREEKENFELIMKIETGIESRDRFYTDLNGFQIIQRKRRQNLPMEGNYYPIPTSIYVEDDSMRMSILTGQPLGGSSLSPGQVEIMLDRRLYQDDAKGLGESLKDNLETDYKFQILLEIPGCPPSKVEEENKKIHTLSLPASIQLDSLLNPLNTFVQSSKTIKMNQDNKIENSGGLPCDIQLIGLFPQSIPSRRPFQGGPSVDLVTPRVGIIVRRIGFDDRFMMGQNNAIHQQLNQFCDHHKSKGFSVQKMFGNLVQPTVEQTSLNFIQLISKNSSIGFDNNFDLDRMKIYSFLVTYNYYEDGQK